MLLKITSVWVISSPVRRLIINRIHMLPVTCLMESISRGTRSCWCVQFNWLFKKYRFLKTFVRLDLKPFAYHSDIKIFWQPWSERIWTDPSPSAVMRWAGGSVRVLCPQEWPCYYSERTYLMLPSLSGGWGRNAASQSISSILTCRLINWWESRWEVFVLCRTRRTRDAPWMMIQEEIFAKNKYLESVCFCSIAS